MTETKKRLNKIPSLADGDIVIVRGKSLVSLDTCLIALFSSFLINHSGASVLLLLMLLVLMSNCN